MNSLNCCHSVSLISKPPPVVASILTFTYLGLISDMVQLNWTYSDTNTHTVDIY